MSAYIDRDAAIRAVCGKCRACIGKKTLDCAEVRALLALPTVSVPQWIPVEERLPELKHRIEFDDRMDPGTYYEQSDEVLVCYKTGEILTGYWVTTYRSDGTPRESYWDDWILDEHESDEVIAWMKLPEPLEVDA